MDTFRPQAPHQQFGAQSCNFGPPTLGFSFTGPPSYDCWSFFATFHNTHLPQFTSPILEPRALAKDAQDRPGRSMYMFPPFPLLSKVIQKLQTTQEGEVILMTLWWPSQPWFPYLLCLGVDHSLIIPYCLDLKLTLGVRETPLSRSSSQDLSRPRSGSRAGSFPRSGGSCGSS